MSKYKPFVPRDYVPITTSDTAELPLYGGLLITATGNVSVEFELGAARTIPVASVPFVLPGFVKKVRATGTTVPANNIFGLLQ